MRVNCGKTRRCGPLPEANERNKRDLRELQCMYRPMFGHAHCNRRGMDNNAFPISKTRHAAYTLCERLHYGLFARARLEQDDRKSVKRTS
jgi:hypothetical protein